MFSTLIGVLLAAAPLPAVTPVPEWVTPHQAPVTAAAEGGSLLLLRDYQVRVGADVEHYHHLAWKVLSPRGVDDIAHQRFSWDPAYEKPLLHAVTVTRNGKRHSAWDPADARVLQREDQLEERIYD